MRRSKLSSPSTASLHHRLLITRTSHINQRPQYPLAIQNLPQTQIIKVSFGSHNCNKNDYRNHRNLILIQNMTWPHASYWPKFMFPSFCTHHLFNCSFCATMYTTSKLNLMISEIIDEVISNWDTEHSKITVESFRRKKDCLVIIKIRNWSEKHHFLQSAISIKPSNVCDLDKLQTLFSHFETYSRK